MAVNAHSRASPGQRPGSLGGSPPPQCLVRGAGTQDGAAALPVGAAAPWPGVLPRPGSQVVGGHRAGMNQPASPEEPGPGLVGLGMCGRWGPTGHFTHAPARSSSRFSSALGRRQPQAAGASSGWGPDGLGTLPSGSWVPGSVGAVGVSRGVLTLYTGEERTLDSCVYSQHGGPGEVAPEDTAGVWLLFRPDEALG